jgi:ligand-binding sensor domain-containing protein/two-component sensor histidine kinase
MGMLTMHFGIAQHFYLPMLASEPYDGPIMRMMRWVCLAIAWLICLGLPRAHALEPDRALTQYFHRIWQVQQGLPQPSVLALHQTQDGYFWLGTQAGLVRFDGVKFSTISQVGGVELGTPWITDLLEDNQRTLWVATEDQGLIAIHGDQVRRYTDHDGLASNNVRCLFLDRGGVVWAGTSLGPVRFQHDAWSAIGWQGQMPAPAAAQHGKGYSPAAQELGAAPSSADIHAIEQTADGHIWFGGDNSTLVSWDGSKFEKHELSSVPSTTSMRAMLSDAAGALWVGTTSGLVRLKDGQERCFTVADGLADSWVLDLAPGQANTLWIGTKDGYSRYQNGQFESFRTHDGLSQSTVYCLCEDHEGSLWVGTKSGLNQFTDRRTIPFTTSEGLPSNDSGPVIQDAAGNIWVGTLGAGLARFDGRRFAQAAAAPSIAGDSILALATDESGIWVGTERGLDHLAPNGANKRITAASGLPSDIVRCLLRDRHGILWVGTSAGLAKLQGGKVIIPPGLPDAAEANILALVEHGDSIVFSTEGGGLFSYTGQAAQAIAQGNLPPRDIDAFYEDPDGLLWMGTRGGGMRLLDGQKIHSFSLKDGLYDDDIYGILADQQGRLWMPCSKGIFYVSRADLRNLAAGKVKLVVNTPFSPTDALRTLECQPGVQPSAWRMKDGKIWFSTIHGMLVIDSEHLQRRLLPPPVAVDEAIVNGTSQVPAQLGELGPGSTNIDFRYTAPSFRAPTRITFRYKLDGFDKNWIDAGTRREATYTNLPPGSYRFHVAAANIDGPYGVENTAIAFVVRPHFYQRWWFWPLCLLVVAAIAFWIYRGRVRRIRGELQAILAERSRIARELHDTLIQGFSGVTMEMAALAGRLDDNGNRSELQEIIQDAGTALREARRSVAGLRTDNSPASGLAAAIEDAAKRVTESRNIRLKLRLNAAPQGLPPETQYNLVRIMQEGVTNAVKHSGGRNVEVSLDADAQELILTIKDDGRGFITESTDGSRVGHYGLIGMRERAMQIGADLSFDSAPTRGTTVRVSLPLEERKFVVHHGGTETRRRN